MRGTQPVSRGVIAAAVGAVVLALTGVVIVATNVGTSAEEMIGSGAQSLPAASVHVKGVHHGKAQYGKHLHVRVTNGALSAVTVNQKGTGPLTGSFNKTHTRWHSSSALAPST